MDSSRSPSPTLPSGAFATSFYRSDSTSSTETVAEPVQETAGLLSEPVATGERVIPKWSKPLAEYATEEHHPTISLQSSSDSEGEQQTERVEEEQEHPSQTELTLQFRAKMDDLKTQKASLNPCQAKQSLSNLPPVMVSIFLQYDYFGLSQVIRASQLAYQVEEASGESIQYRTTKNGRIALLTDKQRQALKQLGQTATDLIVPEFVTRGGPFCLRMLEDLERKYTEQLKAISQAGRQSSKCSL